MSTPEILAAICAVTVAALVQALSGFGFALLAVPLMSLAIDVRLAVVAATVVSAGTTLFNAVRERRETNTVVARSLILASFTGMPFGYLAFVLCTPRELKLFLGTTVIAMTFLLMRGLVLEGASRRHEWVSGWVSGLLATSLSTNGPPLVFLLQGRNVPPGEFRGTISRVFLVVNLVSIATFALARRIDGDVALLVAVSAPFVAACYVFGVRLRPHLDAGRFRVLVLSLMFLSGVSALVTAF